MLGVNKTGVWNVSHQNDPEFQAAEITHKIKKILDGCSSDV
jgi:hypothetical protein